VLPGGLSRTSWTKGSSLSWMQGEAINCALVCIQHTWQELA
jgi:hypothetical protein